MADQAKKKLPPLVSPEKMEQILSSRRSMTSEEAANARAIHTGRPIRPAYKKVFVDGEALRVSC